MAPLWVSIDGGATRVTAGHPTAAMPVMQWLQISGAEFQSEVLESSASAWRCLFTVNVGTSDASLPPSKAGRDVGDTATHTLRAFSHLAVDDTSTVMPAGAGVTDVVAALRDVLAQRGGAIGGADGADDGADGGAASAAAAAAASTKPQVADDADKTPSCDDTLLLLRLLRDGCVASAEDAAPGGPRVGVAAKEWTNPRLTRLLQSHLRTPASVLDPPAWTATLAAACPFLLPVDLRLSFFHVSAFGALRSLHALSAPASAGGAGIRPARAAGAAGGAAAQGDSRLAPVKRRVVVSRQHVLKSAVRLFEQVELVKASTLSVQFSHETGHGLGPTVEFYTLVCRDAQRAALAMWRDSRDPSDRNDDKSAGDKTTAVSDMDAAKDNTDMGEDGAGQVTRDDKTLGEAKRGGGGDDGGDGDDDNEVDQFVLAPNGLFPAPLPADAPAHRQADVKQFFTFLGRFVAQAMQDRRLLDLPLSVPFCKLVRGDPVTLADVRQLDGQLYTSLSWLQDTAASAAAAKAAGDDAAVAEAAATVDGLCLQFTLPGHADVELVPGGKSRALSLASLPEYLEAVMRSMFVDTVRKQVCAFRAGFADFAPPGALQLFSAEELALLLSSAADYSDRHWNPRMLERHVVCNHGYDVRSPQVQQLLALVSAMDVADKQLFLRFITGSPRLPLGGFGALSPKFTIVKSVPPAGYAPDEMLPTCSTCQVYLKLPGYSTAEVLKDKLLLAIREGQMQFSFD